MPYTLSYVSRSTLSTEEPIKYKTPESCCTSGSNYENKTCDNYYPDGCTTYVSDFVSEMFLIIGTVLLAIGVVQVWFLVTLTLLICINYICSSSVWLPHLRYLEWSNEHSYTEMFKNVVLRIGRWKIIPHSSIIQDWIIATML